MNQQMGFKQKTLKSNQQEHEICNNRHSTSDKHGDKTKRVSFWAAGRSQTPSTSVATIATAAHRITLPGFGSALLPRRGWITLESNWIPSGKRLHSYWKWPFIVSFPIKHGDFP